ncbi:metallo-beta-lactamase superfamily protein [Podospora conica]|nr:metallo-beta-lactamase superfamily protein [Schizothecium conicum]
MTTLPPLPEVQRLSPTCIRLLAGNPSKFTLQGTNTYLVGTGRSRLLIDTGEGLPSWLSALRRTLAAENATVAAAVLTHWHHDHVNGVPDLLAACPDAKVYKHTPGPGQHAIADGQRFEVEGATLTAWHTPGHTGDHVVLVLGEEGAMFTGDNVLGHGTGVFEDLGVYMRSLERMGGLFGGVAYPGHGEVVQDGPGKVREYIRHRKMREEQVVKTMQGRNEGGDGHWWTAMELVKVIYKDYPESLHGPAAAGVVQILRKLEKEGRVVADGERWRLTDRSAL